MVRGYLPRVFTGVLLVTALVLAAGCGSGKPATFHPAGGSPAAGNVAPTSTAHTDGLTWPPFGPDAHIVMPGWLPAASSEVPAVIAAKNFLLALLYAEYKGGQDQRWTAYVSGTALSGLRATLNVPSVTTESFRGTVRFSHMRVFADPTIKGAIAVSECFDNSHVVNTSLATGKAVPDHTPADQHYYLNTDVLTQNGGWHVVSVYPVVYYPRARECRP